MSFITHSTITRRSFLRGTIGLLALSGTGSVHANQVGRPAPVNLGHGLEIRDYRLFPTEDVMRFIVEIHNTTDTAVDTPTVGVVLPHLDGKNFGWANPFGRVIYPHSSQGLLGLAPAALSSDSHWGAPEWTICDVPKSAGAESIQDWNVEVAYESHILSSEDLATQVVTTNNGETRIGPFSIQGLVFDQDNRLCGGSMTYTVARLEPGATRELWPHIEPTPKYTSNPFVLIESVEQIEAQYSLQPANPINHGCAVVMPLYDKTN